MPAGGLNCQPLGRLGKVRWGPTPHVGANRADLGANITFWALSTPASTTGMRLRHHAKLLQKNFLFLSTLSALYLASVGPMRQYNDGESIRANLGIRPNSCRAHSWTQYNTTPRETLYMTTMCYWWARRTLLVAVHEIPRGHGKDRLAHIEH